jgi:hypothetical protein
MPGAPSIAGWGVPARYYYLALFCHAIAMALIYWAALAPPFGLAENPAILIRLLRMILRAM